MWMGRSLDVFFFSVSPLPIHLLGWALRYGLGTLSIVAKSRAEYEHMYTCLALCNCQVSRCGHTLLAGRIHSGKCIGNHRRAVYRISCRRRGRHSSRAYGPGIQYGPWRHIFFCGRLLADHVCSYEISHLKNNLSDSFRYRLGVHEE